MVWLNFILIGVIVMVIVYGVRLLLRRALKIKKSKKEFFSYNHINDLHRKVDWAMRIIIMIVNITLVGMILYENISIAVVVIGLVLLIIGDRLVQAFFEWKYSDNPKEAILTLSDMIVMVLSVVIVSGMNLLNLNLF